MGRLEHLRRGGKHRLVPGAGDLEEDLVLPLELDLLVVEAAREEHRPVGADELVLGQAVGGAARLRGGGHGSGGAGEGGLESESRVANC
ncbi:hypothetical protein D3C83_24850 [compost metagenome]